MEKRNYTLRIALAVLWIAAATAGLGGMLLYSTAPGNPGNPPATWPAGTRLTQHPGEFTLLMIVHPKCPCSRASLGELAALMAHARHRVNVYILFVKPTPF